jgi:hypothetical protein
MRGSGWRVSTCRRNQGAPHTPDFRWSSVGSANLMRLALKKGAHAVFVEGSVQEIRGISLVFREVWDTR